MNKKLENLNQLPTVGQVVLNKWGWEQTNADFYQIIKVTAASVKLQAINSTEVSDGAQSMTAKVTPNLNDFSTEETITKRMDEYQGELYLKFDYGSGRIWNNEPVSISFYA